MLICQLVSKLPSSSLCGMINQLYCTVSITQLSVNTINEFSYVNWNVGDARKGCY